MTFRLSMIAAVLLLSSTTAFAGDISTDSARARAAEATRASRVAPVTAAVGTAFSTDQARALAAGGAHPVEPSSEHQGAMACAQACACHHG